MPLEPGEYTEQEADKDKPYPWYRALLDLLLRNVNLKLAYKIPWTNGRAYLMLAINGPYGIEVGIGYRPR